MSRLTPPVSNTDHCAGPDDAPVTLVEYGDYECPHCGSAHRIVLAVRQRMGQRLRFGFRHFPLAEIHPHAMHAAEAAEAASDEGKFWEMHDALFENQEALEDSDLIRYAQELGLDAERVERELVSGVHEKRVREQFLSGVRSGVNGTPTFFISGIRYDGPWDPDSLLDALEAAAE
jgi:protein-disulfide isomerase